MKKRKEDNKVYLYLKIKKKNEFKLIKNLRYLNEK